MPEARAFRAGLMYCAVVLVAGLAMGAVRTFWVAPLAGELVAVWLEVPVMLAISWSACSWVAEHLELSESFLNRLIMGGVALAALTGVEALVAILAGEWSLRDYFLTNIQVGVLLGLLAQLGFAVFPMLQARRSEAPH
jgi:hypothetical protein